LKAQNSSNHLKSFVIIITITIVLWLCIDFIVTKTLGSRGFSQFFESSEIEGRKNKDDFEGVFGSWLDEFNGSVKIGSFGQRQSFNEGCEIISNTTLFLGDSTTAGFEVNDNQTFVSVYNQDCQKYNHKGLNFGVRAHDTHAVIGSYMRINNSFRHDQVVYLMTDNDFSENIDLNAYQMMSKRFGRIFNNELISPVENYSFKFYADLRLFIGDNLSTTTYFLGRLPMILSTFSRSTKNEVNQSYKKKLARTQIDKALELISILETEIISNGAQLFVIPYPCLIDKNRCVDRFELYDGIGKVIKSNLKHTTFIDLQSRVEEQVKQDELLIGDMRFSNDGHLSAYGHKVVGKLISEELFQQSLIDK